VVEGGGSGDEDDDDEVLGIEGEDRKRTRQLEREEETSRGKADMLQEGEKTGREANASLALRGISSLRTVLSSRGEPASKEAGGADGGRLRQGKSKRRPDGLPRARNVDSSGSSTRTNPSCV
jgi:hypothetical protein